MAKIVKVGTKSVELDEPSKSARLHNPFDKAGRFTAGLCGIHVIRFVFPSLAPDIKLVERFDTRIQSTPQSDDRTCDFVVKLYDPQKPLVMQLANLELQGEPQGDELGRGMDYETQYFRQLNVPGNLSAKIIAWEPFVGFAFMKGRKPKNFELVKGLRGTETQSQIRIGAVAFAEIDAAEFLDKVAAKKEHHSLLHWTPLMKGAEKFSVIKEWRRLATNQAPQDWLANMKVIAETFSELAKNQTEWLYGLKDWNVPESVLLKQWTQEAVTKAVNQALTQKEYQERLNYLLRCLDFRFPGKVNATLQRRIKQQKDSAVLDSWFNLAFKAATLAEFRANAGI